MATEKRIDFLVKMLQLMNCMNASGAALLEVAEGMIVKDLKSIPFPAPAGGLVLGLAILLAGLIGAPAPALAAAGRITIESGGVARTALFVQHRRLKKARRPLVIVLRGGREKANRLRRIFGLEEMARSSGPVLVYPDPLGGRWSDAPGSEASRDAAFVHDLIAKLVADGIADRRKILLIGISSGGVPALRLACDDANAFAAVAAVITGMPADLAAACKPSRPLPFLMIAGTADPVIPYQGGKANLPDDKGEFLSADATLAIFAKAAGCGEGRATTAFPDRGPRDGTRAYLDKLNGCKAPVELVRIEGGGHAIPGHSSASGVDSARGPRNLDLDGAKFIWEFFRRLGG
jgi:polyhydroxybutyrate depolymerase